MSIASIRHPKKRAFLAAYAETGNVGKASELAGIDRHNHSLWLKKDASGEYAAAFAEAENQAVDLMETEARRRAVEGVDEPVFYQGGKCGTIRRYSDTLLIFLLKGARPDKYRERATIEHAGRIDISDPDYERIAGRLARLIAAGTDAGTDSEAAPQSVNGNGRSPA